MKAFEFHLMQLADSFFPSGMFGMSGGLESFAKSGRVRNAKDVVRFARNQMKYQFMPCDCTVFMRVFNAANDGNVRRAVEADNACYLMKQVMEVRIAMSRSGGQLLDTIVRITADKFARSFLRMVAQKKCSGMYPSSLAVAANAMGIPGRSALRMMLYTYCVSVTGSAIRLGVITHVESQMILMELANDVKTAKVDTSSVLWQLAPLADILQMNHELDELRMFNT
jgi:urease accessory protein